MTTPERVPVKRPRQIFNDETTQQPEPEPEFAWVNDFIARLTGVIRSIGGKKISKK
jgi:hypothetical protein